MRLRLENESRAGAFLTETLAPDTFNRSNTDKQKLRQIRQRLRAIRATNSCTQRQSTRHMEQTAPSQHTFFWIERPKYHVLASNKYTLLSPPLMPPY